VALQCAATQSKVMNEQELARVRLLRWHAACAAEAMLRMGLWQTTNRFI
jgi:hypothetical protein